MLPREIGNGDRTLTANNPYTICCLYYGEWTTPGRPYNPKPWSWFAGYQERIPYKGTTVMAKAYERNYRDGIHRPELLQATTSTNATLSATADGMKVVATSANPIVFPNFGSFDGSILRKIKITLRRLAGSAWVGRIYYTTAGHSWTESYKKFITQPSWGVGETSIVVDMTTIAGGGGPLDDWITNTITNFRIDLGGSTSDVFEIYSIELLDANDNPIYESRIGLDSAITSNFEWEMEVAKKYGIDVFSVCWYWDGAKNYQQYVFDKFRLHFGPMPKFNIVWAITGDTQPLSGPFSATVGTFNMSAWYVVLDKWYESFISPNYWFKNGKPVVQIFSEDKFYNGIYRNYYAGANWGPSKSFFTGQYYLNGTQWYLVTTAYTSGATFGALDTANSVLSSGPSINISSTVLDAWKTEVNNYLASKPNSRVPNGIYWVSSDARGAGHPFWFGRKDGWIGKQESINNAVSAYNFFSGYRDQIQDASGGSAAVFDESYYSSIGKNPNTYQYLVDLYTAHANYAANSGTGIPYLVPVVAGWEKSPWIPYVGPDNQSSHRKPTLTQWKDFLLAIKAIIDGAPAGATDRTIVVYAWNEFGEGGYICPCPEFGYGFLEALSEVFQKSTKIERAMRV